MRWHAHHHTAGTGHLYQGRFKSFPIQNDEHLYTGVRYVERNALRARLVRKADKWRWSSLWRREHGSDEQREILSAWPLPIPPDWIEIVRTPHTEAELDALRQSAHRGTPFGAETWQIRTAKRLHLEHATRPAEDCDGGRGIGAAVGTIRSIPFRAETSAFVNPGALLRPVTPGLGTLGYLRWPRWGLL